MSNTCVVGQMSNCLICQGPCAHHYLNILFQFPIIREKKKKTVVFLFLFVQVFHTKFKMGHKFKLLYRPRADNLIELRIKCIPISSNFKMFPPIHTN